MDLPTRQVIDVTGQDLTASIELAIQAIKKWVNRFEVGDTGRYPPLVVNFSFGNFAGPHDGTSALAILLDDRLAPEPDRPQVAVLPAGNGNLSRCHAEILLTADDPSETLDWRIQPQDRSPSMVQFWTPALNAIPSDLVTLTVAAPADVQPEVIDCTANLPPTHMKDAAGNVVATIQYTAPLAPITRGLLSVMAHPTASHDPNIALAPSGVWRLTLTKGPGLEKVRLKAWIRRDETLPGFPEYGRQSYFDERDYSRFTEAGGPPPAHGPGLIGAESSYPPDFAALGLPRSKVRRDGTLSGFACGNLPVVIGGYVRADKKLARYSASGPTNNPGRIGPDAVAVSDDSLVRIGVLSAGSHSGSRVAMRGTSVATPQTARWLADRMADNKPANRVAAWVKAFIDSTPPPPRPPINRAGGGRLDLPDLFGKLRNKL